ncbi:SH3 domain-containing protein [Leptolyngbya sp. FACHB-671]|uniref:SH3 domain-containing protein n=1 Tax=Leptolyngbya sp. FACHB-671 TaxID=2692812 RepID=UPI001688039D|nr:SH3 domain-containing protein [Leptolyngbya sp. FACHB-671]MBD2071918.1 SH3 domain-containing protein [Leptolyngbya sp. FACHB-671]
MKPFQFFLIAGAIAVSATVSGTSIVSWSSASKPQLSVASSSHIPTQPSLQAQAEAVSNSSVTVASRVGSYPRQTFELVDEAQPGSDFYRFRERLKQAIRDRDSVFIRSIIPAGGLPTFAATTLTANDLNVDNPDAPFWQQIERAIAPGCVVYALARSLEADADSQTWVCPNVFASTYIETGAEIFIVGENVNVRQAASSSSPVIDVLSNEIVRHDSEVWQRGISDQERASLETFEGWRPIITPNGLRGYVSSRYSYTPSGYRALFEKIGGEWQMTVFLEGD